MTLKTYLAIADRQPNETLWSITFPDLPGVTSVAENFAAVMQQAKDALASAVEEMEMEGKPLPPSLEDGAAPDYDRTKLNEPRLLAVSVQASGATAESAPGECGNPSNLVAAEPATKDVDSKRTVTPEVRHQAHERHFWRRQLRIARWLNYITAVGAVGAVLGLFFVGIGLQISSKQLHEMRAGNIASQRGWLKIEAVDVYRGPGDFGLIFNRDGALLPITITIRNVGNSPAIKVSLHAWIVFDKPGWNFLGDDGDCSIVRAGEFGIGPTIFPADTYNVQEFGAGTSWNNVPSAVSSMDLRGCIDYTFTSDAAIHHQTPFDFIVSFKNGYRIPTQDSVVENNYLSAPAADITLIRMDLDYGAD